MENYVGKDEFGNKYYSNSKGKRWVIYKNNVRIFKNSSRMAFMDTFFNKKINQIENTKKFSWQKKHEENLTGTKKLTNQKVLFF